MLLDTVEHWKGGKPIQNFLNTAKNEQAEQRKF